MTTLDDRTALARDALARLDPVPPVGTIQRAAARRQRARIGVAGVIVVMLVGAALVRAGDDVPLAERATTASLANLDPGAGLRLPDAPIDGRFSQVTAWTGRLLLLWGGSSGKEQVDADGAALDLDTLTWEALPPAPIRGRADPAWAWTGHELVIWGGADPQGRPLADGAAYDPTTRRWRELPPAPMGGVARPAVVWTGTEMVVVGGVNAGATGAAYRPATDEWRTIAGVPGVTTAPQAQAVWDRDRAVFLLGDTSPTPWSWDPTTDQWSRLPEVDAAVLAATDVGVVAISGRAPGRTWLLRTGASGWQVLGDAPKEAVGVPRAVGAGDRVIVWAPKGATVLDVQTGRWADADGAAALSRREEAGTAWTGTELLVWGGFVPGHGGSVSGADDGVVYQPPALAQR
jgi:hypothetical protein